MSVSIGHLALDVPFMPEAQARRLAMGIADGLAAAGLSLGIGEFPTLRIDLTSSAGADTDALTKQLLAEIARQLRRTP